MTPKLPLLVREMNASERSMVLSDWKKDLAHTPASERGWGEGLSTREFWSIMDTVIEKITMPSARVMMACHEIAPDTPMAWAAIRDPHEILHWHGRNGLHLDPELGAAIQRFLLGHFPEHIRVRYNPILELRRWK